jgi:hypothetical protein
MEGSGCGLIENLSVQSPVRTEENIGTCPSG